MHNPIRSDETKSSFEKMYGIKNGVGQQSFALIQNLQEIQSQLEGLQELKYFLLSMEDKTALLQDTNVKPVQEQSKVVLQQEDIKKFEELVEQYKDVVADKTLEHILMEAPVKSLLAALKKLDPESKQENIPVAVKSLERFLCNMQDIIASGAEPYINLSQNIRKKDLSGFKAFTSKYKDKKQITAEEIEMLNISINAAIPDIVSVVPKVSDEDFKEIQNKKLSVTEVNRIKDRYSVANIGFELLDVVDFVVSQRMFDADTTLETEKYLWASMMKGSIDIIKLLSAWNPSLIPVFQNYLDTIHGLQNNFSDFTDANVATLQKTFSSILKAVDNITDLDSGVEKAVYISLQRTLTVCSDHMTSMLDDIKAQVESSSNITALKDSINSFMFIVLNEFQSSGGGINAGNVNRLWQSTVSILSYLDQVPSEVKRIYSDILSNFIKQDVHNYELPKIIADVFVYQWLADEIASNPGDTRSDFLAAVQERVAELQQYPQFAPVVDHIKGLIKNAPNFPVCSNLYLTSQYANWQDDGKGNISWSMNTEAFFNSLQGVTNYSAYAFSQFNKAYQALANETYIVAKLNSFNVMSDILKANIKSVDAVQVRIRQKLIEIMSLIEAFRHVILDTYMPQQEQYLSGLADLLYFYNSGSRTGNQLLNVIVGFSESANNYSFSSWLQPSDAEFTGTAQQASSELASEITSAQNDINKLDTLIKTLQDTQRSINQDLQLSSSQKVELVNQFSHMIIQAQKAKARVMELQQLLSLITISAGSDATHYKASGPTNWINKLSSIEGAVVNGDVSATGTVGGLVNIQSNIQSYQQGYADLGQNQQMILQMRMTEMQQQWLITATSLQILNQGMMTMARAARGS